MTNNAAFDKTNEAALDAVSASLDIQAGALAALSNQVDKKAILRAADAIVGAERVTTCASGSSGFAAAKFSHSLCCIEQPAKFMPPAEAIHGGLGAVRSGDVVIIVSRGGKSTELLPIIDVVVERGATLIGVTENLSSVLAEASHHVVPMVITRESDPLNVMATTSNLVVGALLDAMLAAVMVRTNYKVEQFAQIHPGGAVGARLNKKD